MGRISTLIIALANILHQRFRSTCIVLLTALTTLLITGGSWLTFSLRNCIDSINARLGADGMIVPQSASDSFEGALLYGSPSTFYLTTDTADRVMRLDGIERASPQLFITTFDSSHCSALVQIIGYYPATDFVVAPWLNDSKVTQPDYGEAVVGGDINLGIGDQMLIYSVKVNVVGVLEKTGMGFDNSVFVNMDTAQMLLGEYEKYIEALPLPEGVGTDGVVSAIMIDFREDADLLAFRRAINYDFRDDGIRYVSSQTLISSTSKNLGSATGILSVMLVAIWIFTVFVLAIIFTLALNERRREFGILRAVGATRQKLTAIIFAESALLCAAGAAIGVGVICLVIFPYNTLIERVLQTAYLPPQSSAVIALLAVCLALGTVTGPLASLFSAVRIGKNEAFANIRDGL